MWLCICVFMRLCMRIFFKNKSCLTPVPHLSNERILNVFKMKVSIEIPFGLISSCSELQFSRFSGHLLSKTASRCLSSCQNNHLTLLSGLALRWGPWILNYLKASVIFLTPRLILFIFRKFNFVWIYSFSIFFVFYF